MLVNRLYPHPLQMVSENSKLKSTEEIYMLGLKLKLELDLELKYLPTKIEN